MLVRAGDAGGSGRSYGGTEQPSRPGIGAGRSEEEPP
jgi:hypothetical protein